jgi:hypothetical protein
MSRASRLASSDFSTWQRITPRMFVQDGFLLSQRLDVALAELHQGEPLRCLGRGGVRPVQIRVHRCC